MYEDQESEAREVAKLAKEYNYVPKR